MTARSTIAELIQYLQIKRPMISQLASERLSKPAFLIGVTGHMDLSEDQLDDLTGRIDLLFRFFKPTPDDTDRVGLMNELGRCLAPKDPDAQENYKRLLQQWCGLPDTPVIVLSSLAPGADSLVTRLALKHGFEVRAPISFPHDIYSECSTFVRKNEKGESDPNNLARQQQYAELVEQIGGPQQTFPVWLASDCVHPKSLGVLREEFRRRCQEDAVSSDPAVRRLRFRAAGEYIAAYSHVMIAIWDQDDDHASDGGTASIVDARLGSLSEGVLPTTNALGMPNGGPLIHLPVRRVSNTNPTTELASQLPPICVLLPGSSAISQLEQAIPAPMAKTHTETLLKGFGAYIRAASHLNRFNRQARLSEEELNHQLHSRLLRKIPNQDVANGKDGGVESIECKLKEQSRDLFDALRKVSDLNDQASMAQEYHKRLGSRFLQRLFQLTLAGAAVLHLFAHWHCEHEFEPQIFWYHLPDHGDERRSSPEHTSTSPNQTPAKETHEDLPQSNEPTSNPESHVANARHEKTCSECVTTGLRPILGFAVIVLLVVTLKKFRKHKAHSHDEQASDYRALAEGLRVQFYWNVAGLGESVSANYMQRQRSELDWIRGAIRWSSFPYERFRVWFDELPKETKIQSLEAVHWSWVKDQKVYFKKRFNTYLHAIHFWHSLGWTLALSGMATFFALALFLLSIWLEFPSFAFPLFVLTVFTFLIWILSRVVKRTDIPHHHTNPDRTFGKFWQIIDSWMNYFIRVEHSKSAHIDPTVRRAEMRTAFLAHLLAASVLGLLVLPVASLLTFIPCFPDEFNLAIILGGWFLLLAGLSVGWAERRMFAEHAYQFSTMAYLFVDADRRFESLIERLKSPGISDDEFAETLLQIQRFIAALGKEALDENAEWLFLHRARPLEPLLPG